MPESHAQRNGQPDDWAQALAEEQRKIVALRRVVDLTCAWLAQPSVSLLEACAFIQGAKAEALRLFPDKEATFELLHRPRFHRILSERLHNSPHFLN